MTTVSEVMKSPVVTAKPDDRLTDLLNLVLRHQVRHFPIVDHDQIVGIVTDRDLRLAATHPAIYNLLLDLLASLDRGSAKEIMVREVVTVSPDTPLPTAAKLMLEHKVGCLPVVNGGRLVGIVTTSEILAATAAQARAPGEE